VGCQRFVPTLVLEAVCHGQAKECSYAHIFIKFALTKRNISLI
jgi:hypothetical protein